MPRFKPMDRAMKLLPIDLSVQFPPGTFEHALSHPIDHELNLRGFDECFHNDESGAPVFAASVMLKVILYAYSRGIISSREIATACQLAYTGAQPCHYLRGVGIGWKDRINHAHDPTRLQNEAEALDECRPGERERW
jgi:hypothetical protein